MNLQNKSDFTVEEYLALQRASQDRQIFIDGKVFVLPGNIGTDRSVNLAGILLPQLKGTSYWLRIKGTLVRCGPTPKAHCPYAGVFFFPDILIAAGLPQYHDQHGDVLLNPKVILEVLSEETDQLDREIKFDRLKQWTPTLTDYLLASQDEPRIEHHWRQIDNAWTSQVYSGLDAAVIIASIACTIPLVEVYDPAAT